MFPWIYKRYWIHEQTLHPKSFKDIFIKYKDVFPYNISAKLPPKMQVDHKIELIPRNTPTCKPPYCLDSNEW